MTQLRIGPDGRWHRREEVNGGHETACGKPIFAFAIRDFGADHLCPVCFTPNEIQTGELELIERHAIERSKVDGYSDPDDEPTDPDAKLD